MRRLWVILVRFGFRLLYYELAWTYDRVSWLVSLGQWSRWQQAALPFVKGPTILELGHGPGHLLAALQANGRTVFGVDLSPNMGRLARRRLLKKQLPAFLIRAKVQDLPLPTAVFHTVLSTFPTDYIVDPATLASVYRVLAPNGRLVVIPEGHLTGSSGVHRFIDWLFRITGERSGVFQADDPLRPNHARWEPFRQQFLAAGFTLFIEKKMLEQSEVTIFIAEKTVSLSPKTASS